MSTELKAPDFPESIADGEIVAWHKSVGDSFEQDEVLVEVETDKVVLEVVAPEQGVLSEIIKPEGSTVISEEIIAKLNLGATAAGSKPSATPAESDSGKVESPENEVLKNMSPSIRKLVTENDLDVASLTATGKNGRVLKEDVEKAIAAKSKSVSTKKTAPASSAEVAPLSTEHRIERREPMSRLRSKIAERLVDAQQQMAMLTTFNEINMKPIMELRKKYKDEFEKKHQTRLGFMSFFVRASVEALKQYPAVNASIDGKDILYHSYQDIGVAVSSNRGLVVPVLRDVNDMSLADIESSIRGLGEKASAGKLSIEDLTGGTFTVSNGGVFGSLLSTPIVNPPQTAILGMHKIQDRPMAVNGQVEILPMMYLALSYDHRLIDGKEAVGFLVHIKQLLEEPERLILGL
ncbi:MAG: 2-oxoglutarate dehydrogenase complex dihydrolipoyllysine-residue succinyltransferase [Kangiellaceae bacterium]|nr:2-oxoglutarate dehydrogenase complex dihydrolipoyllysine-residue succinyltransferase [Kangiellaceae bacterium]